jgi:hypothetical protein
MTKLVLLSVPLLAIACTDESAPPVECGEGTMLSLDGTTCIADADAPRLTCGAGTRQVGLECILDNHRRFELRVKSRDISADRLHPISVLALGTNTDGTLVNEEAILSIDRPGAGVFSRSRIRLGEMGALTHYKPCSSTELGCLGPVRFSMALASDPRTIVATLDANLVGVPAGSNASACETPSNVMFFDGTDQVYSGTLSVVDAGWGVNGRPDRLRLRVEPNNAVQGRWWDLEFSTEALGTAMTPGVYENARRPNPGNGGGNGNGNGNMRPGLEIRGQDARCNGDLGGRFEVHSYEVVDDVVTSALISFEQRCAGAARSLRGCVRVGTEE